MGWLRRGGQCEADPASNALVYDGDNRLTSYRAFNRADFTTTYAYDGDGRRVKKTTPAGVTSVYIYDAFGKLVAEYDNAGPGQAVAGAGGVKYLTADHLGSTRVVTDGAGAVRSRHDYLPFGEEVDASFANRGGVAGYGGSDATRQRFAGNERDGESGLDFMQARYCSSAQGRFVGVDPSIGSMDLDNPQSLNRYTYCLNNPLAYIDPDGLESLKVGKWDELSKEQQRLFTTYVQKNYSKEIGEEGQAKFAENLWNTSAAAANGQAVGASNTRLLDQSQLTTFAAVTHMLESKGVIGEVASVSAINGEKQEADFAIQGELKDSNSAAKIEKVFKNNIPGRGHGEYSISRREGGLFKQPNGQVNFTKDRMRFEADVDYRRLINVFGHNTKANADIRVGEGKDSHYRRHIKAYGPIPVLKPVKP